MRLVEVQAWRRNGTGSNINRLITTKTRTNILYLTFFAAYLCHIYSCHDRQHVIAAFSRTSFPHTFPDFSATIIKPTGSKKKKTTTIKITTTAAETSSNWSETVAGGWRLAAATRNVEHKRKENKKKKQNRHKVKDRASCSCMPHVVCMRRQ